MNEMSERFGLSTFVVDLCARKYARKFVTIVLILVFSDLFSQETSKCGSP
jgi:hypothetical protein